MEVKGMRWRLQPCRADAQPREAGARARLYGGRGVTLIELLVVMAIIAVLAGLLYVVYWRLMF
jgi:prepilin-type N-terminal cleavage/methylation domain-containing protein